jgi:hypothetical protein
MLCRRLTSPGEALRNGNDRFDVIATAAGRAQRVLQLDASKNSGRIGDERIHCVMS